MKVRRVPSFYPVAVGCLTAAICLGMIGFAPQAHAQSTADYPTKAIRLIVPSQPSGSTDILARLVGARLSEVLKQPVLVENRASASGVLAGELVARAPADGHTLLVAYHQHTVNQALNPNLPYHSVNDFTPITQLTSAGFVLVVNPASPPTNFHEFLEWTKNSKTKLNYGSAGNGSGGHLAGELYKMLTGVKAQHIPYKGAGPALMELVGGHFQFMFVGMLGAIPLVKAGKLRAIAVTTSTRAPGLPDLPTVAESGLPGFEVAGWYGVMGPAKLPEPVVTRLHEEIVKILSDKQVRERILADGAAPVGNTPAEFRAYLLADLEKWAKVVKVSGAKMD
jgi:tripartite-type tricarboxylate transporter receptor subunit TctC